MGEGRIGGAMPSTAKPGGRAYEDLAEADPDEPLEIDARLCRIPRRAQDPTCGHAPISTALATVKWRVRRAARFCCSLATGRNSLRKGAAAGPPGSPQTMRASPGSSWRTPSPSAPMEPIHARAQRCPLAGARLGGGRPGVGLMVARRHGRFLKIMSAVRCTWGPGRALNVGVSDRSPKAIDAGSRLFRAPFAREG